MSTAVVSRRSATKRAALLLLFALFACTNRRSAAPQVIYDQISQEIYHSNFEIARGKAFQAWKKATDEEWRYRFECQYIWALLLTERWQEADDLIAGGLPPGLPSVQPRFEYLHAYSLYHHHDPSASAVLKAAIALANRREDPVTEADGIILLVEAEERKKPSGRSMAQRALAVARQNHLAFQEVNALDEMGLASLNQQRYAEAIPAFLEASAKSKQMGLHYLEVASLADLGECYFSLGDLDQALRSLQQALPLMRPSEPSELRVVVHTELGSLYSLRKQEAEGLQAFREAFRAAQPLGHTSSYYIGSANNLTQALIQARSFDEADTYNRVAADSLRAYPLATWDLVAAHELNTADLAAGRERWREAEAAYKRVLNLTRKQPPNEIQWSAYARLADVGDHLGQTPDALRNFELALRTIEANRSQQGTATYKITFLSSLIRFYQDYVQFLIEHNQPWLALSVADSSRAGVLTEGMTSGRELPDFADKIQQLARKSRCVLLSYWLAPQASYLWAVTPDGKKFLTLKPAARIEELISKYSAAIEIQRRDTLADAIPAGAELYQILIGPISAHLTNGARLVVVPDGTLHGLNFETLLVNQPNPHYFIDDVTISVAPSLRVLLDQNENRPPTGRALIIGDANYAGSGFAPLPESRTEITKVSARYPNGTVLTQDQAVAEAYAEAKPERFSFIHFSAHVEADPLSPLDSAIILSPNEYGRRRLYARDVMRSHLTADLVTVSGCRSAGAKQLSGEGMVGFAWAAFQAGARNAVTSLWAVDDRSTTDLMDNFYAGVASGQPYALALRSAKKEMLNTAFKKPYYWAPFQLYSRNLAQDGPSGQ